MANPKRLRTVGDLRKAIQGLPDSAEVSNDVIEGPEEYRAGIVSVEAGLPKAWRDVRGVKPGLWFHIRIAPIEK